ncbi:MAG TPA: hypothetical protein VNE62_11900 [Actinomycetota bacterium]|nr:hypothetical protein [Actinomycetota bacterium]
MFVQIFRARTKDKAGVREQFDRWVAELAEGAPGWLGSTVGLTDDGEMVGIARFASEEEARANSSRPEQGKWFEKLSEHLDGDVSFKESSDVDFVMGGGSDQAGFVQLIEGAVTDEERFRAVVRDLESLLLLQRPEIMGGIIAYHGDGSLTEAFYFTSEETAREGESKMAAPEIQKYLDEISALTKDLRYTDIRQPWLAGPRAV